MDDNSTDSGKKDAWDELNLADTEFEQAEEATIRMARLCRVFYLTLTDQGGVPPQIAAPLVATYVQGMIQLGQKSREGGKKQG